MSGRERTRDRKNVSMMTNEIAGFSVFDIHMRI